MKITDLTYRDGTWHAIVTVPVPPDGRTYAVDRRYGSWRITPEHEGGHRGVLPEVAAALQREVRRAERKQKAATCG